MVIRISAKMYVAIAAASLQAEAAASELQPKEGQLAEMHETLNAQVSWVSGI
jgi:hypothetical protein